MKKFLIILFAVICLFSVVSCNDTGSDEQVPGGENLSSEAVFPEKIDYSYIRSQNGSTDHAQSKTIDADLSDWTEAEKGNCISLPVEGGQNMTVYAVKKSDGIYIAYDILHSIIMKSSRDPLINTNVSFLLSDGVFRYVSIDDVSDGVTDYSFVSEKKEGEKRHTVFEIFVSKDDIAGFAEDVYGGFSFKDQEVIDYYWGFGANWSWYDNSDENASLLITEQGLIRRGEEHKEDLVLDGDPSDAFWKDVGGEGFVTTTYNYDGYFSMQAVLKEDGVYIAFTAEHKDNANYPRYWCYNTNFEIKIGSANAFSHHIVSMYEQTQTLSTVSVKEAKMITVYDDDIKKFITLAEIFIPYESCVAGASVESENLYIGASFRADAASSQAVGAMVWTPLYFNGKNTWDMNALRVTAEGLVA